jgi:hypothetical protein
VKAELVNQLFGLLNMVSVLLTMSGRIAALPRAIAARLEKPAPELVKTEG